MALLAHKQQALVGAIAITGMTTPGACLAGIVGVYLDRHALISQGFAGNHALQFGKRPLRVRGIGLPLLVRRLLPVRRMVRSRIWVKSSKPMRA